MDRVKSRRKTPWDGESDLTSTQEFLKQHYATHYADHHRVVGDSGEADMINSYLPAKCPFCTYHPRTFFERRCVCLKRLERLCYEHATTSAFFEDWFEFELLGLIPQNSLVIMDNASFHRKKQLFKIAARHGVNLLFLPTYSPDYNPIEKSWANLKKWLCDNLRRFPNIQWAVECYFSSYHC